MNDSLHPWAEAWETQVARVSGSMKPLVASAVEPGLPMTSLLWSIPAAMIWKSAELGNVALEAVSRPLQSVYSVVPSVYIKNMRIENEPKTALRHIRTVVELDVVLSREVI